MDTYDCINAWLADAGRRAEASLQLNSSGQICFAYDQRIPVTISALPSREALALHAPLLSLTALENGLRNEMLVQALTWNLPGALDPGLSLAADEDADELYLVAQSSLEALDSTRFQLLLVRFMAQAEQLCRELRELVQRLDHVSTALPPPFAEPSALALKPPEQQRDNTSTEAILQLHRSPAQLWG